jgi:hypothetical protein
VIDEVVPRIRLRGFQTKELPNVARRLATFGSYTFVKQGFRRSDLNRTMLPNGLIRELFLQDR